MSRIIGVEVSAVRCRRVRVKFDGSSGLKTRPLKTKRQAAAAGEEVEDARTAAPP
jgi:hypothetical protein